MDKDTLTKKVLEVFSDILPDIDAGKLDMTAELTTEYGVNSVSIIQFIVGLEQAFNIEFDDSERCSQGCSSQGQLTSRNLNMKWR